MRHRDTRPESPLTVPVEAVPVPVVGYDVHDGVPVVVETNDAFEASFDPDPTGTTVRQWLRTASNAAETTIDRVCSALADGRTLDTAVGLEPAGEAPSGPGACRLRTTDVTAGVDTDGDETHVLLTESTSQPGDPVGTDRIASVISHDLRNPLDVANAHLRAARETGDVKHFEQVKQSHDRMGRIIQDVLTLARGEHALNVEADVDLGSVAADAWATVDTADADLSLADDLPTVDADPDRLQRVFENLFRNSVEHARATQDGAGATDEQGDRDADRPLQVRVGRTNGGFFVADDGVGIPAEERGRVFDPGYSSNRTGDGTGLGLTIVEQVAEAHDWAVSVATGSAGGARFEFRPGAGDD
jgi:nitrogen-specific signal transduction histidine kinase